MQQALAAIIFDDFISTRGYRAAPVLPCWG
jgi:hypothetical protein